jgi:hypothetical protein
MPGHGSAVTGTGRAGDGAFAGYQPVAADTRRLDSCAWAAHKLVEPVGPDTSVAPPVLATSTMTNAMSVVDEAGEAEGVCVEAPVDEGRVPAAPVLAPVDRIGVADGSSRTPRPAAVNVKASAASATSDRRPMPLRRAALDPGSAMLDGNGPTRARRAGHVWWGGSRTRCGSVVVRSPSARGAVMRTNFKVRSAGPADKRT